VGKVFGEAPRSKGVSQEPLSHYKQLHEVFSASVVTDKYAFSSVVENDDDDDDEDNYVSDVDGEVAVINSNSVAVVEVRTPRPLSSLSKDAKENSVKCDVYVTAGGKAGMRKRKISKQDTFLEQLVEQGTRHLS
jgi:hypothetical protein